MSLGNTLLRLPILTLAQFSPSSNADQAGEEDGTSHPLANKFSHRQSSRSTHSATQWRPDIRPYK